ncbi:MAG TPA: hypothetical protein VN345_07435, partial [Blastocatellia bacterium]|nr:hypothetical protein [Blastocatellia bacterium]
NQVFSDLIGRRVQEYAQDQRSASPAPIQPRDSGRLQRAEMQASQARSDIASGTPEEVETARSVLGVPRVLQGVVLPGANQQALDQLRKQGPPAGERGFLGRLKEMGKGALLGIETGRGAIPGAIVGAADPDELERERYYTQTLPRAEKLAASEAAQQQEELRRAGEAAGQTGIYPLTGEKTVASANKDALLGLGRDRVDVQRDRTSIQQSRADTARDLGWARIDQGDRRLDQGDTGLLIRRAQTILSGYARGGTLTANDRAALKAAGVSEELPDKYDRTKVEVDPILGRVRFIKPEAGTVNEQTITPRQPSVRMSRQERQQAYQDIVNGLEQNPNWKNHPKRQEIMSRLKKQFQVK